MIQTSPEWHAKARKMAQNGMTAGQIAAQLGKGKTTVRCAIDAAARQRQLKLSRERKARERDLRKSGERPQNNGREQGKQTPFIDRIERAPAPISLAPITILLTKPENETQRLRFAPKSTIRVEAPGVRRWREIHQTMMRRGLIPARPSVIEEMHR